MNKFNNRNNLNNRNNQNKRINERLILNKQSVVLNNLSGFLFKDIKENDEFKCVTFELPTKYMNDDLIDNYNLVCKSKPMKSRLKTNYYMMEVSWNQNGDESNFAPFYIYQYSQISSQFIYFFGRSSITDKISGLFILFKDATTANNFIKNYNKLYKDEISGLIDEIYDVENTQ